MLINKKLFRNRKIISFLIVFTMIFSCVPQNEIRDVQAKEKSERIIVSMGDSYSSGEGVTPFYGQDGDINTKVKNPDWLAHRSQKSWGGQLKLSGVEGQMSKHRDENWFFVAASGAETKHITKKQTKKYTKRIKPGIGDSCFISGSKDLSAQIDVFKSQELKGKKIDYVTITIGGNDVGREKGSDEEYGFSDIIETAAKDGIFNIAKSAGGGSCTSKYVNFGGLSKKLTQARKSVKEGHTVANDIENVYKKIYEATDENATIIVAGYPKLFADSPKSLIIFDEEAAMINDATVYFNKRIEEIVKKCSDNGMKIKFVSVEKAFENHGAYSDKEYINRINYIAEDEDLNDKDIVSAYSMHPNKDGVKAYADCVQKAIDELENNTQIAEGGKNSTEAPDDSSPDNSVDPAVWKAGYLEKVDAISPNYLYCLSILKDINGDGIPELFMEGGNDSPDGDSYSYTFKDGEVQEMEFGLGWYASEVCYFATDKYLLRADYGQDVGGMNIRVLEIKEDALVDVVGYTITGMYAPECKSTFEIKTFEGDVVSEESLKDTLNKYGFVYNCTYDERSYDGENYYGIYTVTFVTKEGNGELETIYGFDLLKKSIENYGTDIYDKAMSESICDGDYQAYKHSFSEGLAEDWQIAFYNKIREVEPIAIYDSNGNEESAFAYFLYDIEKDGTPELFIRYGNCEAAFHYSIYKYENGGLTEYKSYCSHTSFFSIPEKGFVTYQGHMGSYCIAKNSLSGGEIRVDESVSDYTEEAYPEPEDIYPGAEYLTEHCFKSCLPLFAYGKDIKTKSNKSNDETKKILQDALSDNERVYAVVGDSYRAAEYLGYDYLSSFFDKGDFDKYNDLVKDDVLWGDLNGDGQEECILELREAGSASESRNVVILSYQCGIVYAYSLGYLYGEIYIQDGLIVCDDCSRQVYFYKNEFYYDSYW